MLENAFILAQASPIGGTSEVRVWLAIIGLFIGLISGLFGVVKYILALKIEPLAERLKKLEDSVEVLQKELLQQVIQIAEDNHKHRLEQQQQFSELRLLLSENYAKKEDLDRRISELNDKLNALRVIASQNNEDRPPRQIP